MQLQLIGLVKHLNQVKDAAVRQLQTGLERLTGERRKKSQYSAELGNHTVIYKSVSYSSPDMTLLLLLL